MLIFQDIINFVIFHHHHMSYITGQQNQQTYTYRHPYPYMPINNRQKRQDDRLLKRLTDINQI